MRLTVNGKPQTYENDPDMPLLWYLRDDLRLTGTRFGCGAGLCGACTVHVNGQAVRSCQTRMGTLESKTVLTIDALAEGGKLHPVQRAWIQHDVPQCGYCQSGQIMQAAALLKTTPNPTDAQIDSAMAGNICRCGTYQRIRAAIKTSHTAIRLKPDSTCTAVSFSAACSRPARSSWPPASCRRSSSRRAARQF
jgi:isoquinoline 1-oxidoreductase alpha subunit